MFFMTIIIYFLAALFLQLTAIRGEVIARKKIALQSENAKLRKQVELARLQLIELVIVFNILQISCNFNAVFFLGNQKRQKANCCARRCTHIMHRCCCCS